MAKAYYYKRSGFADEPPTKVIVSILGFLETTVSPEYSTRDVRCAAAVIAFDDGKLQTVKLSDLRVVTEK